MNFHEDDDDSLDENDDPADADVDESEHAEGDHCPYCRKLIYEQAEVCPHCGSYLSREDVPNRKPLWMVTVVVLCLAAILLGWVLLGR